MTAKAPKSILKKTAHKTDIPVVSDSARDQRNRELALYHANLIQQQKDVETEIFHAIETLLDFPPAANADPKRPSPGDVARFKELITPFQPGDYDSLIEERHCADLCGYALCPKPPKQLPSNGRMALMKNKGETLKIVPREQLEIWCSEDCARRALYIKVQLSEEPAWLRRSGEGSGVTLLVDEESPSQTSLPYRPKHTSADPESARQVMTALALERGENASTSDSSTTVVNATVIEKKDIMPAAPPQPGNADEIEGYRPKRHMKDKADSDEESDHDWF